MRWVGPLLMPSARQPDPSLLKSDHSAYRLALHVWLVLLLGLAIRDYHNFDHAIGSTDDAMRLFQIRQWLDGSGWYGLFTDRFDPPRGYHTHWSRLVDAPIAGMMSLLGLFMTAARAQQWTMVVWPLIPLSGVIVAMVAIIRQLAGEKAGILAIAAAIACLPGQYIFKPGEIDHHNLQLMMSLILVSCIFRAGQSLRAAMLGGIAASILLALGFESLHVFVLSSLFLVLMALTKSDWQRGVVRYFLALGLSMPIIFIVNTPPSLWLVPRCDALAINTALAVTIAALALAILFRATRSQAKLRPITQLTMVLAAVFPAAIVFLAIDPVCRFGPLAELDPRLYPLWLDHVGETRTIFQIWTNKAEFLAFFSIALLALPAAALTLWRRQADAPLMLLFALVLSSVALAFFQIRSITYVSWFGAVLATICWCRVFPGITTAATLKRLGLVAVAPMALALLGDAFSQQQDAAAGSANTSVQTQKSAACLDTRNFSAVSALPAGIILSHIDLGPYLLANTSHKVVMGPYHRAEKAIIFGQTAFSSPENESRALIGNYEAKIDYIIECAGLSFIPDAGKGSGERLREAIVNGRAPSWLQKLPMPEDNPLLVFRFTR